MFAARRPGVWLKRRSSCCNQGPPKTSQPLPDPGHIPMVFGKDIPWKGENGERSAALFGDPSKPGIYGVLINGSRDIIPGPISIPPTATSMWCRAPGG